MPPRETQLPTGTLTFLFTDIEGSTLLLSALGDGFGPVLEAHGRIIRSSIAAHGGTEVSTEGDAFFAVFPSAIEAVRAVVDAQRDLAAHQWPDGMTVRVRMGLHTGEAHLGGDNYVGMDVHRAARIAAAGHGGQVLLSDATRALTADALPAEVAIRTLGTHRLKDLPAPERIWQLDIGGLPVEFPALRSLDARPGNLPRSPTPLIGRAAEINAVAALLGHRPLVTLIGPGGTGKTRLGLAVAERLAPDFADGTYFVALQDARERATVGAAVAGALGVRERPDRDLEQGVREFLRDRRVLLVLDNFEQVLPAAPIVSDLLAASPGLRVIVTSRAVLHLSAEHTFEVPPLAVPDGGRGPQDAAVLEHYEAIALFVDRARAVNPDFQLTEANAAAVAGICRRLDGLPLAVELAAARTRLLTPEAILERLERRLPLLTGGAVDLPARQRTLRGAIDWSYDLLTPPEQRLFERLSVFAGGWTVDAADRICNPSMELGIETLDGLSSLLDESLIRPMADADTGPERRYGMLQVIREYATERLDAGPDSAEIRRRHADHVLALVEAAEPELRASNLRTWQHRLRATQDNVREALRWALAGGDLEVGLRTAGALWDYWHYWADLREGARWLDQLLAAPGANDVRAAVRLKALRGLAGLVYWQGDADRTLELYDNALALARQLGDERTLAATLHDAAWGAVAGGHLDLAVARANESAEQYRAAGDEDRARVVTAWRDVAPLVTGHGGDPAAALELINEAVRIHRRLGLDHEVADWLETRVMVFRVIGDFQRADDAGRETLRVWSDLGTLGRLPLALKLLAAVQIPLGRPERAVRLGAAAERWNREVGGELPEVIAQLGDPVEEARPLLDPAEHARAVAEGRSMSLEEQIAYALD